jgi:hypothetical protein
LPAAFCWQASKEFYSALNEFLEQHTVTSICFENQTIFKGKKKITTELEKKGVVLVSKMEVRN